MGLFDWLRNSTQPKPLRVISYDHGPSRMHPGEVDIVRFSDKQVVTMRRTRPYGGELVAAALKSPDVDRELFLLDLERELKTGDAAAMRTYMEIITADAKATKGVRDRAGTVLTHL